MMIDGSRRAHTQLLGRGDAVSAGHVDVEQNHVDIAGAREGHCLGASCDAASDVYVRLKAQQLGQVIACLGNVVDDDDVYAVSHSFG